MALNTHTTPSHSRPADVEQQQRRCHTPRGSSAPGLIGSQLSGSQQCACAEWPRGGLVGLGGGQLCYRSAAGQRHVSSSRSSSRTPMLAVPSKCQHLDWLRSLTALTDKQHKGVIAEVPVYSTVNTYQVEGSVHMLCRPPQQTLHLLNGSLVVKTFQHLLWQ